MNIFSQDVAEVNERRACRTGFPEGPDVEARELIYTQEFDHMAEQQRDEQEEYAKREARVEALVKQLTPALLQQENALSLSDAVCELAELAGVHKYIARRAMCNAVGEHFEARHVEREAAGLDGPGLDRVADAIAAA